MHGLISAYRLTNETGKRIASLKGMPNAWNDPTFLPDLLKNPGPLLLYDRLYLDQRSYEHTLNALDPAVRPVVKEAVESPKLSLFELIDAEKILSSDQSDYAHVAVVFRDLSNDDRFEESVRQLETKWGSYARPNPLAFEAMNIPVLDLLRRKWSAQLGVNLVVLDHPERAVLHKLKSERALSYVLAPTIASLMIDLVPKFFATVPFSGGWDIDLVRRLRDSKHLRKYRNKVDKIASKAAKNYSKLLEQRLWSSSPSGGKDVCSKLQDELLKCQRRVFDELREAVAALQGRVKANAWSIAGGVVAGASPFVSMVLPPLGLALGVTGGGLILAEQTYNHFERRRCGWAEFLEFVASELKRPEKLP